MIKRISDHFQIDAADQAASQPQSSGSLVDAGADPRLHHEGFLPQTFRDPRRTKPSAVITPVPSSVGWRFRRFRRVPDPWRSAGGWLGEA